MNPNDETNSDPIESRLRALRGWAWDRLDHRNRLEDELMRTRHRLAARSWRSKTLIVGGVVVFGGLTAAATVALIGKWILQEQDLPGSSKRVIVTNTESGATHEFEAQDDDILWIEQHDGVTTLNSFTTMRGGEELLAPTTPDGTVQPIQPPCSAPDSPKSEVTTIRRKP